MKTLSLSGHDWTVQCVRYSDPQTPTAVRSRALPALVPGCVHQDLIHAGVLGHTDFKDGEAAQAWVGHADWEWRRSFDVPPELLLQERVDLVFESVDTVAELRLNGELIGTVANQFHRHRFEVKALLREGANEVTVAIRAPVDWVKSQEAALGPRPVNGGWTPYPFIRKSACSFGWDWGPRAPSSGIGAVALEAWSGARIESVRPLIMRCTPGEAVVEVHVAVVRANPTPASQTPSCVADIELTAPDGRRWSARADVIGEQGIGTLVIEKPLRWWPRGLGSAALHDLRVQLKCEACVHSWRRRIGLRKVELETGPDELGDRFVLKVNDQTVFCTGANWIPAALHPICADRARYDRLLELACEANINMLRVWGGGIYETEHFYERCSELGLMVWQDFMFACATYPEDAPYPEQVECEARHQVSRLSPYPCVVLWCGGNEDVLAWQSWGFREQLATGQSWGERFWLRLLPDICAELDPSRPYWPESPWSGSLDVHANDPSRGDRHTWDLRVEEYRTLVPRFTSEFGHQSPPNLCTLREALGAEALTIGNAALAIRQRAGGGDAAQYELPLAQHFAPACNFEEWLYQAHLLQARAMQLAITWLRANRPRSMGCLFWQWNDVWTGPSWSAVDVRERPKPMWHALQRAAAPRIVSVEPLGPGGVTNGGQAGDLRAVLVNDTSTEWQTWVTVRRLGLEGAELASARDWVVVAPWAVDSSIHIERLVGAPTDPTRECLVVEAERQRGWWMYRRDAEQEPHSARVQLTVTGKGTLWKVHVQALSLVRELWIEPQAAWVRCSPNLISLLPGEEATWELELEAPVECEPPLRVHAAGGVVQVIGAGSRVQR